MRLSVETREPALRYGMRRALEMIAEAGFDAVDLSFGKVNPNDDPMHRPDREGFALSLAAHARELGLGFVQAHAPFRVKYSDKFDRTTPAYDDVVRTLEFAAAAGIPRVVVHALKTPPDDLSLDYREVSRRYYLSLAPYCEKLGVVIAVENLFYREERTGTYYGLFPTPCMMTEFVRSLNDRSLNDQSLNVRSLNVRSLNDRSLNDRSLNDNRSADRSCFSVCCDLGHTAVTGLAPEQYIRGMSADLLGSLHVQDTDFLGDRHTLPYMGKQDWDAICRALADIGYRGDFSFELPKYLAVYPDELLPAALEFAAATGRYLIEKINRMTRMEQTKL